MTIRELTEFDLGEFYLWPETIIEIKNELYDRGLSPAFLVEEVSGEPKSLVLKWYDGQFEVVLKLNRRSGWLSLNVYRENGDGHLVHGKRWGYPTAWDFFSHYDADTYYRSLIELN